jgi:hypothetical protein
VLLELKCPGSCSGEAGEVEIGWRQPCVGVFLVAARPFGSIGITFVVFGTVYGVKYGVFA